MTVSGQATFVGEGKPVSKMDVHKVFDDALTNQEPILQFFKFNHLPEHLKAVSEPFCNMAQSIVLNLPRNPERTIALRKLLESKDAAVRAKIYKHVDAMTINVSREVSK